MELRTLRYFCAIVRERHFTRAAQTCNISQSALSHQIRKLEEELDCRLFERSSKRVELTPAGAIFFKHCLPAVERIGTGIEAVRQLSAKSHGLRIGVRGRFLLSHVLPASLRQLQAEAARAPVQIVELTGLDLFAALGEHRIDLAIASEVLPHRGFVMLPLFMEELALGVHHSEALASRKSLPLKELNEMPLAALSRNFATRLALEHALAQVDAKPLFVAEFNSPEALRDFASQARLPAVGPVRGFHDLPDIVTVRLVSPTPAVPVVAITREATKLPVFASHLIETIRCCWDRFEAESAATNAAPRGR